MTCDIFVDMMAGFFWVMNDRQEIVHYVLNSLPHKPMFFGLRCSSCECSIRLQSVLPKIIKSETTAKYIRYVTQHLSQMLQREQMTYRLFSGVVSDRNELQVRMYGKRTCYIICFYCILSLIHIAKCSILPLPLTLMKDLIGDYYERIHICNVYPALFEENTGLNSE